MSSARSGMALPAAIAAVILLAGFATLANISATAAIRESRALRDIATGRMERETVRARALYQLRRRPRAELVAAGVPLGFTDTTLATSALAWPWHTITVSTGGAHVFAEFARANVPALPWCSAVVFAAAADISAGTLVVSPPASCADRIQVSPAFVSSFDSALVADLIDVGTADTLTVSGPVTGVLRAARAVSLASGANVTGIVIAPVVRILSGASVRGIVVARDSLSIASGSAVTADANSVFSAMSDRARLFPVGRRGLLIFP